MRTGKARGACRALGLLLVALAVLMASCGDDSSATTTEAATTTTEATTTTTEAPTRTTEATTTTTEDPTTTTTVPPTTTTIATTTTSASTTTSGAALELDHTLPAIYGEIDLANGFTPDPTEVSIQAGGPVDLLDRRPSCSAAVGWGWASAAPSFEVNWTGGNEALLRFYFITDEGDPLLVVRDPSGNWMCNDDYTFTYNLNPIVEFMHPEAGTYDIWVNSFGGGTIDGTLYITQIPGNHP